MITQVPLTQQWLANGQLSASQDVVQNVNAANALFNRAKKRGMWRRLKAWLSGRSTQLQDYPAIDRQTTRHAARGVQYITLDQITGSEGRSRDFDDQFWPITGHSRDRWVNIAIAIGTGKPLPPVQLIRVAGGYVVRDGNHRLSVARAFGQTLIEAEIV